MITGVTTPTAASGVSTTSSSDAAAIGVLGPGGKLGKDEFLRLLVTQLRSQDPMNPLEGQEVAANLAQFSALEQLVNIGEAMEGQAGQNNDILTALNNSVAMTTLGRTVTAVGDEFVLPDDGKATLSARIDGKGMGTLRILDANGKEVGKRDLGIVDAGRQTFDVGAASNGLAPGVYHYAIDITGADGKAIDVQTYTIARVDGISYDADGDVLTAGPLTIPIGSIVRIES